LQCVVEIRRLRQDALEQRIQKIRRDTTSNSAGANAPATLFHDARQVLSFKLLPARRFRLPE
jgi:hypothetical protein